MSAVQQRVTKTAIIRIDKLLQAPFTRGNIRRNCYRLRRADDTGLDGEPGVALLGFRKPAHVVYACQRRRRLRKLNQKFIQDRVFSFDFNDDDSTLVSDEPRKSDATSKFMDEGTKSDALNYAMHRNNATWH